MEACVWDWGNIEMEASVWDWGNIEMEASVWDWGNIEMEACVWDWGNIEMEACVWDLGNIEMEACVWDLGNIEMEACVWDWDNIEMEACVWDWDNSEMEACVLEGGNLEKGKVNSVLHAFDSVGHRLGPGRRERKSGIPTLPSAAPSSLAADRIQREPKEPGVVPVLPVLKYDRLGFLLKLDSKIPAELATKYANFTEGICKPGYASALMAAIFPKDAYRRSVTLYGINTQSRLQTVDNTVWNKTLRAAYRRSVTLYEKTFGNTVWNKTLRAAYRQSITLYGIKHSEPLTDARQVYVGKRAKDGQSKNITGDWDQAKKYQSSKRTEISRGKKELTRVFPAQKVELPCRVIEKAQHQEQGQGKQHVPHEHQNSHLHSIPALLHDLKDQNTQSEHWAIWRPAWRINNATPYGSQSSCNNITLIGATIQLSVSRLAPPSLIYLPTQAAALTPHSWQPIEGRHTHTATHRGEAHTLTTHRGEAHTHTKQPIEGRGGTHTKQPIEGRHTHTKQPIEGRHTHTLTTHRGRHTKQPIEGDTLSNHLGETRTKQPIEGDTHTHTTHRGETHTLSNPQRGDTHAKQPTQGKHTHTKQPTEGRHTHTKQPTEGKHTHTKQPTEGKHTHTKQPTEGRHTHTKQPTERTHTLTTHRADTHTKQPTEGTTHRGDTHTKQPIEVLHITSSSRH
ncbi:CMP-N-acetylneuraminate-beta-1,4-galactoside alpha-2,3-sialyltransferase isoform X1 [Pelobates cultripes]|uniref:CMP-N-acetylneuraminate-beta-1,4-galactoside alpha-2,3-sialyltransferase isoform X1 n=1 Tax=Pelobates cultripes TaxID=61616 RepID=A0AAD1WJ71_PELCU|nr:CMP-N-acetylneuraminate-beta-1,4-galactoside alpha-2,3-sialyltransferase isoform X1 [Pelobates cultripes]